MLPNLPAGIIDRAGLFFLFLVPLGLAFSRAAADFALTTVAIIFIVRSLFYKDWSWAKRPDIACFIALWLFILISAPLISHSERSVTMALIWGRFILFYAAATTWLMVNPAHLRLIALSIFGLSFLLLVDGYWQYLAGTSISGMPSFGGYRLTGPLSHPNIGNLILKLMLPALGIIFYHLMLTQASLARKYGLVALVTISIILIPLTGERSTTLLMIIAFVSICSLLVMKSASLRWPAILGCLLLAVVLAVLYHTQEVVQLRVWHVIYHFNKLTSNVYAELYKMSFFLWLENPLMGHGAGSFRELCNTESMDRFGITYCNIHPHNVYFEWLAESGLIGLSLYIAGVVCCFVYFLKSARWRGLELLPSAFGLATILILFWPLTVTQSIHSNWGSVLMWFSLSLAVSSTRIFRSS